MTETTINVLKAMTARELKDVVEPTLIVSEQGPMGVALAVLMPWDDFQEVTALIHMAQEGANDFVAKLGELAAVFEKKAVQ